MKEEAYHIVGPILIALLIVMITGIEGCNIYPPNYQCTDSDGGIISDVKGTAIAGGSSMTDFCLSNDKLMEYYCDGNTLMNSVQDCSDGCKDGACIKEQPQITVRFTGAKYIPAGEVLDPNKDILILAVYNPHDFPVDLYNYTLTFQGNGFHEMPFGGILSDTVVPAFTEKQVVIKGGMAGPLFRQEHCNQIIDFNLLSLDRKLLTIWPLALNCEQVICADSDGGENYGMKGTTSGIIEGDFRIVDDTCLLNEISVNSCSGEGCEAAEFFCTEGIYGEGIEFSCPSGCSDGVCLSAPAIVCNDSDGGIDYYTKGTIDMISHYIIDSCLINPRDIGTVTGGPGVFIDWDGGKQYDTTENCSGNYCFVGELYCKNEIYGAQAFQCPFGCSDGACIQCTEKSFYNEGTYQLPYSGGDSKYISPSDVYASSQSGNNFICLGYGSANSTSFATLHHAESVASSDSFKIEIATMISGSTTYDTSLAVYLSTDNANWAYCDETSARGANSWGYYTETLECKPGLNGNDIYLKLAPTRESLTACVMIEKANIVLTHC